MGIVACNQCKRHGSKRRKTVAGSLQDGPIKHSIIKKHTMSEAEHEIGFVLTKYNPYLALTGELWSVVCETFWKNIHVITIRHCTHRIYLQIHTLFAFVLFYDGQVLNYFTNIPQGYFPGIAVITCLPQRQLTNLEKYGYSTHTDLPRLITWLQQTNSIKLHTHFIVHIVYVSGGLAIKIIQRLLFLKHQGYNVISILTNTKHTCVHIESDELKNVTLLVLCLNSLGRHRQI